MFFAGSAFVQCPLTLDYGTADIFLKMAGPDMLSAQGTAIAAALETSRELLAKGREGAPGGTFQAILLVTDGEDLEGDWKAEAEACVDEGIRVSWVELEGPAHLELGLLELPLPLVEDPAVVVIDRVMRLGDRDDHLAAGPGSSARVGVVTRCRWRHRSGD